MIRFLPKVKILHFRCKGLIKSNAGKSTTNLLPCSLTLTNDQAAEAAKTMSPAGSATALDEKEIEEMIKLLPEGSGMRGKPICLLM